MQPWCRPPHGRIEEHVDEPYLDLGAEAFRRALAAIGITDLRCKLFEAGHHGIEYHYPLGLLYLADCLAP
jgi:hypothetical protein